MSPSTPSMMPSPSSKRRTELLSVTAECPAVSDLILPVPVLPLVMATDSVVAAAVVVVVAVEASVAVVEVVSVVAVVVAVVEDVVVAAVASVLPAVAATLAPR